MEAPTVSDTESGAKRYERLKSDRQHFLDMARDCAKLTLPFVCPPDGMSAGQRLAQPWQSIGSRGVNNLSAKLLLALFPPNTPFFKLAVDRFELKKINKDPKLKTQLEEALSEIEQAVLTELETSAVRPTVNEALVHLIITGNGLLEVTEENTLKFYRLDRYVVQRDPMGHPTLIIIHETVAPEALPDKFLKQVQKINPLTGPKGENKPDQKLQPATKNVDLYTVIERVSKTKWEVWQEAFGKVIPETESVYPADKLPFIPLRFTKIDGEDYGRGLVEQYIGDLGSVDGLQQSVNEGAVAAAKVLFLVKPNGTTDAKELAEANNGDFVQGNEEDVKALQLQKFYDFKTAKEEKDSIEARLNAVFLILAGLQRDAERVTAEEIRALIQELETSLGGVYSVLAQELQLPLAAAYMARMAKSGRLPKLPKKVVRPTITTGVEALGRGNDLQKLDLLVKDIAQTFGPNAVPRFVNASEYLARRAAALGITAKGLIRTEEEIAQADAAAQQQAQATTLTEKVVPVAAKAMADAVAPQT